VDCDSQYTHTSLQIEMREVRLREGPVVSIELTVFTHDRLFVSECLKRDTRGQGCRSLQRVWYHVN
jgi:hypothetical protein